MKTKVIAYYLPQFHEIPENDKWWEKGFTEWTNVKRAKPFFKGQIQPRIPLNGNYYDLMDKETVRWQTELSHKYGIYGFCYFHYYFKDGRKILEKPAENLLKWTEIDQNFCFFWANNEWKRTWSAIDSGTTWVPDCDEDNDKLDDGILLEQDYGGPKEWTDHFDYLLRFFKDSRYIKIDNKPFLAIYKIEEVKQLNDMLELWNRLAVDNGFDGLYIVSVNNDRYSSKYILATLLYDSGTIQYSLCHRVESALRMIKKRYYMLLKHKKINVSVWDYKQIWRYIIRGTPFSKHHFIPGGIVNTDETPRRGDKALVYANSTPQIFEKYMGIQLRRTHNVYKSQYLFLNSWNEWGEGSYLEPDENYGYQYLEALKRAIDDSPDYKDD